MVGLIPSGLARSRGFYPYKIDHALRLNAADSTYLERTPSTTESDRTVWTFSTWIKRSSLANSNPRVFGAASSSTNRCSVFFNGDDRLIFLVKLSGATATRKTTTAVFRDPSQWMHIHVVYNSTLADAEERARIYINGRRITDWSENIQPSQDQVTNVGFSSRHTIGNWAAGTSGYVINGYFAATYLLFGQDIDVSKFGTTKKGVWVPKQYADPFPSDNTTFYLNYADAANLGKDVSGNGNDFIANNITSDNQVTDTPTNNQITYSPLVTTSVTLEEGATELSQSSDTYDWVFHTSPLPNTGKWYWEVTLVNSNTPGNNSYPFIGMSYTYDVEDGGFPGDDTNETNPGVSIENNGVIHDNGTTFDLVDQPADGDVFHFAIDMDNRKGWFGINGNWYDNTANQAKSSDNGDPDGGNNPTFTIPSGVPVWPAENSFSDAKTRLKHNSNEFSYSPPAGFKPLNAANLPKAAYITSGSYTGNGSSDGPFVYTGAAFSEVTIDGTTYQNDGTARGTVDFLANGFKLRSTTKNANGASYSWSGVVSQDFKYANAQVN